MDKKLSEIEEYLEKSNNFVASVLADLETSKKRMEAMGWTEENIAKVEVSPEDRRRAIKKFQDMGYGHLFEEDSSAAPPLPEPEEHVIKVNRKMRRFNMI